MRGMVGVLVGVAFVAGGAGAIVWFGKDDPGTSSWYPWPSRRSAARLIAVGVAAALLAAVAWVFATMT